MKSTQLIAAAKRLLEDAGYLEFKDIPQEWSDRQVAVFEDEYGIAALVTYETCHDLVRGWMGDQGHLVSIISDKVGHGEPKAAEGYLTLLTPDVAKDTDTRKSLAAIRYDTSRVRKLVATGEEATTVDAVRRVLSPLLPLTELESNRREDTILARLPTLLHEQGLKRSVAEALVRAYSNQEPLLEAIHESRRADED